MRRRRRSNVDDAEAEAAAARFRYLAMAARGMLASSDDDARVAAWESADGLRRLRPSRAIALIRELLEVRAGSVGEAIGAEWAEQRDRHGGDELDRALAATRPDPPNRDHGAVCR